MVSRALSLTKITRHDANQIGFLFLTAASAFSAAADDTAARITKAGSTFDAVARGIRPEQIASSDCIAVIPGSKKGAAVVGAGYGRGFISCRSGNGWSAPGAMTFESGSVGVQLGGEVIDIVILSLDKERRAKLLAERFAIGPDASAAWGNGKSAHEDPNVKILFFGRTKRAFAGFGLDGATLKVGESGNKALYGKTSSNSEIVTGATTPPVAQLFVTKLTQQSK